MTTLTEFAPAKINLALHVLGRRPDGFHELDSIVAFADAGDELEITPSAKFSITASGPFAHRLPQPGTNIIHAAWKSVGAIATARGMTLPPVSVKLTKNLPIAAGIGGGSANAAAAMRAFINLAGLGPIDDEIQAAALQLGADVPVCLAGKACRMQGIGDRITALQDFTPLHVVLVNPMLEVSTSDVFRRLALAKGESHGKPIAILSAHESWRNDLLPPAMAIAPVIGEVIQVLKSQAGVSSARMSGSGATCFAICADRNSARNAGQNLRKMFSHWWISPAQLSG